MLALVEARGWALARVDLAFSRVVLALARMILALADGQRWALDLAFSRVVLAGAVGSVAATIQVG